MHSALKRAALVHSALKRAALVHYALLHASEHGSESLGPQALGADDAVI